MKKKTENTQIVVAQMQHKNLRDTVKHSQGNPKDSWNTNQYVDYYNRIIAEQGFEKLNLAGDPSCYAKVQDGMINIVLHLQGNLIYLPIGGSEYYLDQIANAKQMVKAMNMHDGLIDFVKMMKECLSSNGNINKQSTAFLFGSNKTFLTIAKQLLKEADQK